MRSLLCVALCIATLYTQNASPDDLFRQAVDAQQRGDFAAAITGYQRFLKLRPNSVDALANLGAALAHTGKLDEAVAEYRKALQLDRTNTAIRMNLALAFYKKGDSKDAATEFAAIHATQPLDVRAAILLADCDHRLGKDDEAIALLTPLDAAQPGNPDLEYVLGSALISRGKRREGATMLEQVGKAANSADAYLLAGSTLIDINDFDGAKNDIDGAFVLNPSLPGVHTMRGVVRDKLGDQAQQPTGVAHCTSNQAG